MPLSFAVFVIALIVAGVFGGSAHAGAISGTLGGDSTLIPTGTPGVFTQDYTGDGTDTTFGPFSVASSSTIDFSHPPTIVVSNGRFTETFSAGQLFGTSSGNGTASGTGTATATVDVVFTGGTGLFASATGDGTILQTLVSTGPTTTSGMATYTGDLLLIPEPSSLALLAAGACFAPLLRRRATASSRE